MNIVYLSPIPYDFLVQRPQYLAIELSKRHNVIFVEPTVSLVRWALKGGEPPTQKIQTVSDSLHVVRLNGMLSLPRTLCAYDLFGFCTAWEGMQLKKYMHIPDLVWVGYCGVYPLVSKLKYRKLIYDKMDENALLVRSSSLSKQLAKNDQRLLEKADCIFTTAMELYDGARCVNQQTYLVQNAVAHELANKIASSPKKRGIKTFGYIGMIDSWFDIDAIKTILEASENHEVLLVGPNNIPEICHKRAKYLGRVSKDALPELINSFDVCLYPFRQNQLLETVNPVKIYEYLAFNKPVLAVDNRELRAFGKLVRRYTNHDELRELCTHQFPAPFDTEEARLRFVEENSWERRGQAIHSVLEMLECGDYS